MSSPNRCFICGTPPSIDNMLISRGSDGDKMYCERCRPITDPDEKAVWDMVRERDREKAARDASRN